MSKPVDGEGDGCLKVAIGVDASQWSERAVKFYCSHIHQTGYKVMLIHCVEPVYLVSSTAAASLCDSASASDPHTGCCRSTCTTSPPVSIPDDHWKQAVKERREKVQQLKKQYHDIFTKNSIEPEWRIIEMQGNAGQTIVTVADDQGAGMIVVGSRGQGIIRRTILGSISDYVMLHAKMPVLICH